LSVVQIECIITSQCSKNNRHSFTTHNITFNPSSDHQIIRHTILCCCQREKSTP
jgi:hypothetical protein